MNLYDFIKNAEKHLEIVIEHAGSVYLILWIGKIKTLLSAVPYKKLCQYKVVKHELIDDWQLRVYVLKVKERVTPRIKRRMENESLSSKNEKIYHK